MKLQYLAVIFILIILPISLVMSTYIQNQIDAIGIQASYDKSLIDATYDALKAFQLNTTNNKYSSISDSKIRDIEASVNTFYSTLLTSMSRFAESTNDLRNYTPAMLFTLYDGYYVYTSYNNIYSTIGEEESEKVQIDLNTKNYQNGLKPYVYYSSKYKLNNENIIVVNYTLDNEITVYGDFGDGYVTKSGYLINPNLVDIGDATNHILTYDGVEIRPEVLTEHLSIVVDEETMQTQGSDYRYIYYQNKKIYQDHDEYGNLLYYDNNGNTTTNSNGFPKIFWYDNYVKTYINDLSIKQYAKDCKMMSISAYEYYAKAIEFSNWVVANLGKIKQSDTVKIEDGVTTIGNDKNYLSENTGDECIFDVTQKNNDPLVSASTFNNHRLAIIRKSIETNLYTVISKYGASTGLTYEMPVISEEDWYSIVNNVSLVTFMQGLSIGYRVYNNYAVVTNNINKEVIKSNNIYIVVENNEDNTREYHQPGCKELLEGIESGKLTIEGAYPTASFQRQSIRKSENSADDEYFYLQAKEGKYLTGCYNCIVSTTSDYNIDDIIAGNDLIDFENKDENGGNGQISFKKENSTYKMVREIYLKALARERYDIYKSNFDLNNLD